MTISFGAALFLAASAPGQQASVPAPSGPLTLREAVRFAAQNYPAMHSAAAEVSAAEGGIDLARTEYLPETELLVGVNRATRNNVFGLILPNSVIPGISGPVQEESTYESTFGSAAGALFSWEPFDFGWRKSNVQLAQARKHRADAGREVTEYNVSLGAAGAFLTAVANQEAVKAAQATVERMEVFAESVSVLVRNELRPGADESRARAELARARTELIRAEQAAREARATLAERLGVAGEDLQLDPRALLGDPPSETEMRAALELHPLAQAETADVAVAEARRRRLEKAWRPKFEVLSAFYARGTGADIDGTFQGGANGLAPSEGNWAVGFNVEFEIFGYKRNQAERRIARHDEAKERAEKQRVVQELRGGVARARIAVDAAREVAANTPVELEAAQTLEMQARERYRVGLGTVVEVAEAQRLLRQAEVENALAKLGVWQALFALGAAQGEMEELLTLSSR